ncbi:MAG: hypothetical protein QM572_14620 [Nocardioides sp.]|uniref:hypothetical protein n=1 Tax=Nocardioides sp. TaxID=35761 RepID=UPI0039E5998E
MEIVNSWIQVLVGLAALIAALVGLGRWSVVTLDARDRRRDDAADERTRRIVREEIAGVRTDLGAEIAGLRTDLGAEIAGLKDGITDLRHHAELTNQRLGALEADVLLIKQRLIGVA